MDVIGLWPWMLCPQDKDLVTETPPVLDFRKKTVFAHKKSRVSITTKQPMRHRPEPPLTTSCLLAPDEDSFEQKQKMM